MKKYKDDHVYLTSGPPIDLTDFRNRLQAGKWFLHNDVKGDPDYKVEPNAVVYHNCEIGEGSIIGAGAVLRPYTKIGHHSIFGTLSVSEGYNQIGNYTTIHAQCHITTHVTIGNNCFIAPYFIATNTPNITKGKHGSKPDTIPNTFPTIIGNNVRIGSNVRLIPGITIGNNAVIDQDCLITRDVFANQHIRGGKDKIGRPI